jgi:hypothetical protein
VTTLCRYKKERERDCIEGGGAEIFSGLKVPRQCPFGFLVEVSLSKGKALESGSGRELECSLL